MQYLYQRLLLFHTMETTLDLRIATLYTHIRLTKARRARSCLISLHSYSPALLAAMDLQPFHVLVFTRIPGTSQAPISIEAIIMRKWSTPLIWTWHEVITPSKFHVLPTDMSIPLCPITEDRYLCFQIPGCPLPQPSMTHHTIAPVVSHHKSWMSSSSRGIGAVSSKFPGPVLLTGREPSEWKTFQARRRPTIGIRSTMNR